MGASPDAGDAALGGSCYLPPQESRAKRYQAAVTNLYRLLRITEIPHCRSPNFPRQLSGVEGSGGA